MHVQNWSAHANLTNRRQHRIHAKSRSPKTTWLSMLHSSEISYMTEQPGQEGVVAYCWAITHHCYMFACSRYGDIHSPTIPQKSNSSHCVWSNLRRDILVLFLCYNITNYSLTATCMWTEEFLGEKYIVLKWSLKQKFLASNPLRNIWNLNQRT